MTDTLPAEKQSAQTTSRGRWIEHWEPEDEGFWASVGRKVARRNLIFSIFAEHLGFSVWVIWSILVVQMGKMKTAAGVAAFPDLVAVPENAQKIFWIVALPNLIGALMRIPYTLATARFGGRNWTIISALLLLIPVSLATYCITHPGTSYPVLLLCAATAGFGGGNFASSMANISYFFPEKKKGLALGLNAAGGNIGIASMQLTVPVLVAFFLLPVDVAAKVWFPLVVAAAICAFFFMDNLHVAKSTLKEQFSATREKHAWIMSFLYVGTFGSFLGLAAAFPAVLTFVFPENLTVEIGFITFSGKSLMLPLAFMGPLVGSLVRPFGGWLADHIGGALVTAAVFALMAVGSLGAIMTASKTSEYKSFGWFLFWMLLLFAMSGAGNGSAYRMIPSIFKRQLDVEVAKAPGRAAELTTKAKRVGAATLGMAGALGAIGGFILPKAIGDSIKATGSLSTAFSWFIGMYLLCMVITVVVYLRPGTPVSRV
ncbi:MAG TPA: nitrate/nitrite transporter [Actinoplanes sp.]|nr:nitrate/nitrite transporter [Actinoplanes sp.]